MPSSSRCSANVISYKKDRHCSSEIRLSKALKSYEKTTKSSNSHSTMSTEDTRNSRVLFVQEQSMVGIGVGGGVGCGTGVGFGVVVVVVASVVVVVVVVASVVVVVVVVASVVVVVVGEKVGTGGVGEGVASSSSSSGLNIILSSRRDAFNRIYEVILKQRIVTKRSNPHVRNRLARLFRCFTKDGGQIFPSPANISFLLLKTKIYLNTIVRQQ